MGCQGNGEDRPRAQVNGDRPQTYLVRHSEATGTISRQRTGRTDIPLTKRGEREAEALGARLKGRSCTKVLTSPLQRARRPDELAGIAQCKSPRR